jgi:uncharacterized membrane protein
MSKLRLASANLNDLERIASAAMGAGLVVAGLTRRRRRTAAVLAGAGLLARAASGYCPVSHAFGRTRLRDDPKRALAGDRGVLIEETVTIARTAEELYAYWRQLDNLPQVFSHLDEVRVLDDRTSRWRIHGPLGATFEWDAEIISDERPHRIGWQSLPGADIATAGSVHFRERTRRGHQVTEVTVRMQYNAPGGKAAHVLAWLAGQAPELVVREELRRLKQRWEAGSTPTGANRSALAAAGAN